MRFHKLEESIVQGSALVGMVKGELIEKQKELTLGLLRSSQKFFCGDLRSVPHLKDYVDFPRLPFPVTAFEYVGDTTGYFCLACEFGDSPLIQFIFWMRDPDRSLFLGGVFFERDSAFCQVGYANDCASESEQRDATDILITHFKGIGDFLSVLNCVNVKTETIEEPHALNKKRTRNGKVPVYSYHTLVLKSAAARRETNGGTHEAPRIHLRRGHIKRRKTGSFWWQPCVVGDRAKGVVMKDYEVHL